MVVWQAFASAPPVAVQRLVHSVRTEPEVLVLCGRVDVGPRRHVKEVDESLAVQLPERAFGDLLPLLLREPRDAVVASQRPERLTQPQAVIPIGATNDFDAKHTDAVTGYYFPERKEFLYFYMGYPRKAQPRKISPFGSAQAAATQKLGETVATKRGVILEPLPADGALGFELGRRPSTVAWPFNTVGWQW